MEVTGIEPVISCLQSSFGTLPVNPRYVLQHSTTQHTAATAQTKEPDRASSESIPVVLRPLFIQRMTKIGQTASPSRLLARILLLMPTTSLQQAQSVMSHV